MKRENNHKRVILKMILLHQISHVSHHVNELLVPFFNVKHELLCHSQFCRGFGTA